MCIEDDDRVLVSTQDAASLARNQLHIGDVVITRTGANAGDCALFNVATPAVASSHTFIVRSKYWNHAFLVAFLNTDYGRAQLRRARYGAAQPEVAPYYLKGIWIPRLGRPFQRAVSGVFKIAQCSRERAKNLQAQAEQTLLQALGFEGWEPPEPLTYTQRASEALAAGRIDSDYFAPARYAITEKLAKMPHRLLSDCCDSIRELFDPTDAHGISEVRNFDLGEALKPALDDSLAPVAVGEIGSTKKIMKRGDVVISRLRSYLRQIAVVGTSDTVPTVGSSEFFVLRPRAGISPELLMVFLRSQPVQTILKYCQEGNQHPRFSENNLMEIPFPDGLVRHSEVIIAQIRQAHLARQGAQTLLAKAKRAVEVAIEEGEPAAMKLIASDG